MLSSEHFILDIGRTQEHYSECFSQKSISECLIFRKQAVENHKINRQLHIVKSSSYNCSETNFLF